MKQSVNLKDQLGNRLTFNNTPKRIVSLVPSLTHTLASFGLDKEVVGVTRFCKWPESWKKNKRVVGGTKDFKIERIMTLQPDLVLANKEENTKDLILELSQQVPVYVSDVNNLETNVQMLSDFGRILNKETLAQQFIDEIKNAKSDLLKGVSFNPSKAVYMIWKKPWMTVGGDTFINQMLQYAGFENIYQNKTRYPKVDLSDLQKINPEIILLSSEPYTFKLKDKEELQVLFPDTCIILVPGEPFTWFGTYTLEAFNYFKTLQKQLETCIAKKKN
jgi:ABC-type Fe3+-hydroxamate transport system substrate-binding protein